MAEAETPPYWQPPATLTRRRSRQRPILHSSLVLIIVPSLSLLFIVFVLLPSVTPRIIPKPNSPLQNSKGVSVKKSWDSLNIVLVIFAILCGVFARRNDDVSPPEDQRNSGSVSALQRSNSERRSSASVPEWGGYAEQRIYSPSPATVTGISRLRRTVSEMPPSAWETGNDRLRFFDDFDVSRLYPSQVHHHPHHYQHHYQFVYTEANRVEPDSNWTEPEKERNEPEADGDWVNEIPVDNFVLETRGELSSPAISPPPTPRPSAPPTPPPPTHPPPPWPQQTFQSIPRKARATDASPPPPPPPPPPANHNRPRRTFQTIPREERTPHAPPPPPPPTPPLSQSGWGEKKKRSARKRMNATKEIGTALASLYNHRKRKRKQKYQQNLKYEEDTSPPVAESLPPPPPPPPSVFHSMFRKGSKSKSKKVHSLSSSIPEPPPPPPRPANSARKPPRPVRPATNLFERDESFTNSGSQSPATPVPPPPPPPPPMRLGGCERVLRGAPDPEVDGSGSGEMEGGDEEREWVASSSTTTTACPSPDVNAKADTFIARHHHGWRLEKLNSWREKHNGGPTLRPIF